MKQQTRIHYCKNGRWAELLDRYGRVVFAGRAAEARKRYVSGGGQ